MTVDIHKVMTLEAANHGRTVLEGALVVAGASILPGDAIDVFLRSLLDAVDRKLPAQLGAVGGGAVAWSSGGLRPGWAVAAGPIIDADSVGIIAAIGLVIGASGASVLGGFGGLGTAVVLGRLVLLEISLISDVGRSCVILVDASKIDLGCEASGGEGGDEDKCEGGRLH